MGFRQHDKRRCQTEKERIAVRLRCRGSLCGNDAAAAWTVDDQDLLCPHLREAVGDDPRNHIRSAGSGTTASPLKADMPDSPRDVAEIGRASCRERGQVSVESVCRRKK